MDNWRLNHLLELSAEDPKDEFVLYAIAQEYVKAEDYPSAIKQFNHLRDINPDYVGLYYHLAAAQIENEDEENALDTYIEGISVAKKLNDQHALGELMNAKTNLELGI